MHAGQFIDRIGVSLGLQFPAGPALEKFAGAAAGPVELPVSVKGCKASLSGPATAAERKLAAGEDPAGIALGVQKVKPFTGLFITHAGNIIPKAY